MPKGRRSCFSSNTRRVKACTDGCKLFADVPDAGHAGIGGSARLASAVPCSCPSVLPDIAVELLLLCAGHAVLCHACCPGSRAGDWHSSGTCGHMSASALPWLRPPYHSSAAVSAASIRSGASQDTALASSSGNTLRRRLGLRRDALTSFSSSWRTCLKAITAVDLLDTCRNRFCRLLPLAALDHIARRPWGH